MKEKLRFVLFQIVTILLFTLSLLAIRKIVKGY